MKKSYVLLIITLLASSFSAEAQLWNKLKKKAEEKLEEALAKKTMKSTDNDSDQENKPSDPKEGNDQDVKVSRDSKGAKGVNKMNVTVWRNYKFIPGEKVIIGTADCSEARNLALSKKRAEAIKTAIIAQGIDAKRITTLGKGESEPIT